MLKALTMQFSIDLGLYKVIKLVLSNAWLAELPTILDTVELLPLPQVII